MKMQIRYKVVNVIDRNALDKFSYYEGNTRDNYSCKSVFTNLQKASTMCDRLYDQFKNQNGQYSNYVVLEQHYLPRKTMQDKLVWQKIAYSSNPDFMYSQEKEKEITENGKQENQILYRWTNC